MFSQSLLRNQQNGLKNYFNRSSALLNRQKNFSFGTKNSITKLFDDCAWQTIKIEELEKVNEEVLSQVADIQDIKKQSEDLNKLNKDLSNKMEKLKLTVEIIDNDYREYAIHEEPLNSFSMTNLEGNELIYITKRIFGFYRSMITNIDYSYQALNELQFEKERKKHQYNELLDQFTIKNTNGPSNKDDESSMQIIESSLLFKNLKINCDFLAKIKNSISFFGRRLHRMIESITRICRLLDFNYHVSIFCPFQTINSHSKPLGLREMESSVVSDDGETFNKETKFFVFTEKEQEFLDNNYQLSVWIENFLPCFGQYDPSLSFSSYFLNFFESATQHVKLLDNYFIKLKIQHNNGLRTNSVSLPKTIRRKEKKTASTNILNKTNGDKKSILNRVGKINGAPRDSMSKLSNNIHKRSVPVKKTNEDVP